MSIFHDKALKGVAEAAAKIMAETSHGSTPKTEKEKSLAALAHPKDKITHKDVLVGRGVIKKEEVEKLDEAFPTVADAKKRMDAGKTATGSVTKTATGLVHKRDYKDDDADEAPKKSTGYGARQNYKRSTRVNEAKSFTEMLELYNEHGLKILAPIEVEEEQIGDQTIEVIDADKVNGVVETIVEEPDNEQFTKELKDQEASAAGKKKQPKVAAGRTMGVKTMPESVEQIDEEHLDELSKSTLTSYRDKANVSQGKAYDAKMAAGRKGDMDTFHKQNAIQTKRGFGLGRVMNRGVKPFGPNVKEEVEQIDERELTKGEAKKKEDYVMGMKKKLSGFKQRYGDRAKEVMYATATKMAKKD